MRVYTVHAPLADGLRARVPSDRFVFVRDGFHVWALVGGVFWLLYHRLWLSALGYLVIVIGVSVALALLHVDSDATFWVFLLLALLMGFEASSLRRWTLSRRKWRQLDVIVASDEQAAERRFFDRWTEKQREMLDEQAPVDRGGPPPTRDNPGQSFSRPPPLPGIVGLFPQPGAST